MGAMPSTAAGFYQMFQNINTQDWSGADQFTSFRHNGHQYWLFGDTILGNETATGGYSDDWRMIGNSIMLQQGDQLVPAMASGYSVAVPDPATRTAQNSERYWTQAMFAANGHIYVLAQRVVNTANGFDLVGGELMKYSQNTTTGKLTLKGTFVLPGTGKKEVPGPQGIQWCSDAVVHDGYVYLYGATLAEGNGFVIHFSYVARAAVGSIEVPSAWRFYKASTGQWVSKISELDQNANTQPDGIVPSQVASVRYVNGKWVMLDKPWNGLGASVRVRTSATPYGPWTDAELFNSPASTFEGLDCETYCPQLHPEFALPSGKVLVSIARNFRGADLVTMKTNADLYKAEFYEFTI